jgi:CubicO group peptidase (beta-lactamase class C family)
MKFAARESALNGGLFLLLCVCLSGYSAPIAFAQTAAAPALASEPYADARAHAHSIGNELIARGIPGLAVAVAVDGHLVYAEVSATLISKNVFPPGPPRSSASAVFPKLSPPRP